MGLLDELKQSKPFENEHQKAIVNIIYTSNWLIRAINEALKPKGLTYQQYNVLRILRGHYPQTMGIGELKTRMIDPSCDVSRMVERLRKKGWLDRKVNIDDRRRALVVITNSGLSVLQELDTNDSKIFHLLDSLSQGATETLNEILDKVRE